MVRMLPAKLSTADRFKLARDVGFEVAQVPTQPDERKAEESREPPRQRTSASIP